MNNSSLQTIAVPTPMKVVSVKACLSMLPGVR